jgi:hypothetical protein
MMPMSRKHYAPLKEKTFENVLTTMFQTEFGFLGGPAVIKLIVNRITELFEEHHPKTERLHFGQMLWFVVDNDERKSHQKGMKHLKLKPVILSVVTPSDIEDMFKGVEQREILKNVMARLFKESYAQGGPMAEHDVAIILHRSRSLISRYFTKYLQETKEILPSRGVVHNTGGGTSHKEIIVSKYFLEGKESPEISREVDHSVVASDRYIKHANQVKVALRNGVPAEEIPYVTGLSRRLVDVYIKLLEKISKEKKRLKNGG